MLRRNNPGIIGKDSDENLRAAAARLRARLETRRAVRWDSSLIMFPLRTRSTKSCREESTRVKGTRLAQIILLHRYLKRNKP